MLFSGRSLTYGILTIFGGSQRVARTSARFKTCSSRLIVALLDRSFLLGRLNTLDRLLIVDAFHQDAES